MSKGIKHIKRHELSVLPVLGDPSKPVYRDVHPNLLTPPFRMAVVGSSKSGKCLCGDGKVKTRFGMKRIIDMDIGEYIYTREGYCRILDIIYNGKKNVYDYVFRNGSVITCTEDHKIDTKNGLIRAGKLLKSDVIFAEVGTTGLIGVNNPRRIETYDLTIENTSHTFYYNNISVSNSNYVVNLLRPCYYGGGKIDNKKVESCFDRIFIFSPNIGMDSTTRCFKKLCQESDIKQSYNDSDIKNIIDYQKANEGNEKILIIADDLPGLGAKPDSLIFSSSSYLRHLNCSIIYISQVYKGKVGGLPPLVRNNIDSLCMFRMPSEKQVNDFCEDMAGTFNSKNNVKNLLDYCTKEPFQFAFFNYRDLCVFKNHTDHLWDKYTNNKFSPDFIPPNNREEDSEISDDE
jgi:hypothetical protein